jgi:hypothetical protein
VRVCAVKFKLSKISGSDDLLKGLHRLLFNRDGTVSVNDGGCTRQCTATWWSVIKLSSEVWW